MIAIGTAALIGGGVGTAIGQTPTTSTPGGQATPLPPSEQGRVPSPGGNGSNGETDTATGTTEEILVAPGGANESPMGLE
jgi:hypothetical protein